MKLTEKDILLSDYLEHKITEAELLARHPEWREDIEMIKLSIHALDSMEFVQPKSSVSIVPAKAIVNRLGRRWWYVAAGVAISLFVGLSLFTKDFKSSKELGSGGVEVEKADEKIVALWNLWQKEKTSNRDKARLISLAVNDQNSAVRYIALQQLSEQGLFLEENELYQYLEGERNFNNQVAWIELWVKIHHTRSKRLQEWLSKENINPQVKAYGEQIVENI